MGDEEESVNHVFEFPNRYPVNLEAIGHERICDPRYRWDRRLHAGKRFFIFQYTVSGQGFVRLGAERERRVGPGDAFLVDYRQDFEYFHEGREGWEFFFLNFIEDDLRIVSAYFQTVTPRIASLDPQSPPIQRIRAILGKLRRSGLVDQGECSALAYDFLTGLHRELEQARDPARGLLQAVDRLLREEPSAWSVSSLARAFGYSREHFSRLFRSVTGRSAKGYLLQRRLQWAGALLQEPGCRMGEIARRVGFTDASHFAKVYRRIYGCSPSEARGTPARGANRIVFP